MSGAAKEREGIAAEAQKRSPATAGTGIPSASTLANKELAEVIAWLIQILNDRLAAACRRDLITVRVHVKGLDENRRSETFWSDGDKKTPVELGVTISETLCDTDMHDLPF